MLPGRIWPTSDTQSDGGSSIHWFGRKQGPGRSPTTPTRETSTSPAPHYVRRRPETPPLRVTSPTGVAGRIISAPFSNPTLVTSLPEASLSPTPLRARQISAPHTNPTLTLASLLDRNRADSLRSPSSISISKSFSGPGTFVFPRPSDVAIELLFTNHLKSRGATELPGRNIDQKWQLIHNDHSEQPQSSVTVSLVFYLKTANAHLDIGGSSEVETLVEYELAKCLQYIFNNESGIVDLLEHGRIVSQIASVLNSSHLPTLKLLTDFLVLLTRINDERAYLAVLRALDDLSLANDRTGKGLGRYDFWLNTVESMLIKGGEVKVGSGHSESDESLMQYMLSTFHLINSILDHSDDSRMRFQRRMHLEVSGLDRIVDIAKSYRWAALDEQLVRLDFSGQTKNGTPVEPNFTHEVKTPLRTPQENTTVDSKTNFADAKSAALTKLVEVQRPNTADAVMYRELEDYDPRIHNTRRLNIKKRTQSQSAGSDRVPTATQGKSPPTASLHVRNASLRVPRSVDAADDKPIFSVKRKPVPLVLNVMPLTTSEQVGPQKASPSLKPAVQVTRPLVHSLEKLLADRGRQGRYRQLLACRKSSAQGLLDMFQRVLDVVEGPSQEFRRELIVATQRLAGKSGMYPVCYELNGITNISPFSENAGAFADIFKGVFSGRPVCLKALRMSKAIDMQQFLKACSKEAILWSQLDHPNLLPFYGIYRFRNGLSLVSPWMEHGDINIYLQRHRTADRVLLASDVIQGLKFLHENDIIHGDLKGANILVDDSERACVADFGLSSVSDSNIPAFTSHSSAASKGGSARWQAPELVDPESGNDAHNTVESDVYAYSSVLYEIFVAKPPLYQYSRDTTVSFKVMNGERPTRPKEGSSSWEDWGLTEDIWTLMKQCWLANPKERPAVGDIIRQLRPGVRKDTRPAKRRNTLAPADFREMTRNGLDHGEMSVETFEALLKSG
ncbi:hypothetical protein DXG01_003370 [Tephrocybe rancida]|nr:hypothetical protein DXG01_003370 [Tephrocybe rancida]